MDSSTLAQPAVPLCLFQSTLGFVLVGSAWGLTTPFIRRAAVKFSTKPHASLNNPANSWLKNQILKATFMVLDLLRTPAYALPLVINLTGSIWFFLLVGKAELSLAVPITNSLAFIFTVLGEWCAEGKAISRDTWIGMAFVLGGIALCVHSKTEFTRNMMQM